MPNAFAERLLDEADGHLKIHNYQGAARLIDQALAMEPKNLRALSYGADVALTAGHKNLALDPFPYTGHSTTLDGLWMGVPVVTLAGATATSRGSLSILTNAGLSELAVRTKADYVALAVALAQDRARLRELRAGLRGRLERSVLMDASRFARQAESAYRAIWHNWCKTAPARPASPA